MKRHKLKKGQLINGSQSALWKLDGGMYVVVSKQRPLPLDQCFPGEGEEGKWGIDITYREGCCTTSAEISYHSEETRDKKYLALDERLLWKHIAKTSQANSRVKTPAWMAKVRAAYEKHVGG